MEKRKNSPGLIIGGIIVAILVILAISFVSTNNRLASMEENVNESYAQVQNVVQRRADLIPNLVNTVKGYSNHESDTLIKVTEARSGIKSANSPKELAQANEQLSQAVREFNVVMESYPELKADKQYVQLMDELAGTENRISVERKNYNEQVKLYNTRLRKFPGSIIANMSGFEKAEYFEADANAQDAPTVDFGN